MSTGTHLRNLANSAAQLLDCEQVTLCLHGSEATLSHPLLALFFAMHASSPRYYASSRAPTLFPHDDLWAICNSALLTGQSIIRGVWRKRVRESDRIIGSMMIALLECPAGVVGFLFCTSRQSDAFSEGEQCLLAHYIPMLARQVEQIVSASCLTSSPQATIDASAAAMQEQSAFLSLISHELRVPLTAIKGYTGLLRAYGGSEGEGEGQPGKMSEAQQLRYLDVIMQQVNHLEVLVGDVLDVSHIQSGHLALHCTPVDLGSLCRRVAQLMQYRIDQQKPEQYSIICSIDSEISPVWADVDRVQQVLTNLVENALKYSPAGGLVEIQARAATNCACNCTCIYRKQKQGEVERYTPPETAFVCVTVRDQGIGIPLQLQSSLFKPFIRLKNPATRNVSGTGLGLYIARKLIEALHGQVFLHSSEGKGTEITFSLPIAHGAEMHPLTFPNVPPEKQKFYEIFKTLAQ